MSKNFIITLNRECGAGATNIAKLLSKELDIPYYDKDMFRMVSDKSGVLEEFFSCKMMSALETTCCTN